MLAYLNNRRNNLLVLCIIVTLLAACRSIISSVSVYIDSSDELVFENIKKDIKSFAKQRGYACKNYDYSQYVDQRIVCEGSSRNIESEAAPGMLIVYKLDKDTIEVYFVSWQPVISPLYRKTTSYQKKIKPEFLKFFSQYKDKYNMRAQIKYYDFTTKSVAIP